MTKVRTAYLYTGLPGAGKSTAADIGYDYTGGTYVESGDMVRNMAADDGIENPTSEELAEYAARQREELGDAFFAEKITNRMLMGKFEPDYPLHLSGVRHIKSVRRFRQFFELVPLLRVVAPQRLRLERLNKRGREGEDEWDMGNLAKRDKIEIQSLGQETICKSEEVTYTVDNSGTYESLNAQMRDIIESVREQEETMEKHYD